MITPEGQHVLDVVEVKRGQAKTVWTCPEEGQRTSWQKDGEDGTARQKIQWKTSGDGCGCSLRGHEVQEKMENVEGNTL